MKAKEYVGQYDDKGNEMNSKKAKRKAKEYVAKKDI